MPCICRLIKLSFEDVELLLGKPERLTQFVNSAAIYTDVYRYWDAIQYLLTQHRPERADLYWLQAGQSIADDQDGIPAARVISAQEVQQIYTALQDIEPDDLIPYYEATQLDAAGIYPQCWERWEETFDPLGQVLEHYWFLKQFFEQRAAAMEALLLYFEWVEDGSDDFDND